MSLHMAMVSIEGDHLHDVREIFESANYKVLGSPTLVKRASELDSHLQELIIDRCVVKKLVYEEGGWTHIADFEMVMYDDKSIWEELSKRWNTRILNWICEGASGTYAFSVHSNGVLVREFFSTGGEISKDIGEPLSEEASLDLTNIFEDDITKLSEYLGAGYRYMEEDCDYYIYLLDESHLL